MSELGQKIKSMYASGIRRPEIVKSLGITYDTVRYHINKDENHTEKQRKKRREKIKQLRIEAGGKCIRCGYDKCLTVLQFHHRNPSQKKFDISTNLHAGAIRLKEEIEKCDLLCANCHMELTWIERVNK